MMFTLLFIWSVIRDYRFRPERFGWQDLMMSIMLGVVALSCDCISVWLIAHRAGLEQAIEKLGKS